MVMDDPAMPSSSRNYSFYDANIVLPRVKRLGASTSTPIIAIAKTEFKSDDDEDEITSPGLNRSVSAENASRVESKLFVSKNSYSGSVGRRTLPPKQLLADDDLQELFVPRPPSDPKTKPVRLRPVAKNSLTSIPSNESSTKKLPHIDTHVTLNNSVLKTDTNQNGESLETFDETAEKDLTNDKDIIHLYKDFLNKRYGEDLGNKHTKEHSSSFSDSEVSISSLSDSGESDDDFLEDKTLTTPSFQPLYSLPIKDKQKKENYVQDNILNKIVISNSKTSCSQDSTLPIYQTGSLPDLRSIDKFAIKRVSHVAKNESEAESEPGAQIGYKFRPLPPIPGTSSNISTGLYETIDGNSKSQESSPEKEQSRQRSFKKIATFLTLIPKLTTNSVRSRKNDHHLADISQYLPDKKLKIFIGTWNMKGTKYLPDSLDDFLLPPESIYLQDVYVIGTQEGTPFRREWQVRLQETFGPSHVLMQSSNFGVLQLSVFVRRELVWFCSSVEQDTTATRVGHKIKTKGALAISFSIFGTSFLFITSHFTSNEGKLRDRINDYRSICQNIQLPYRDARGDEKDVTTRFDRVFWFGDFNFRVRRPRQLVDKLISEYTNIEDVVIKELLQYDQLNDIFKKGKIFHGFTEAPIHFMPTYKFDVNTNAYDTSSKQRVPSWTDRVVHKSMPPSHLHSMCYNSCNSIKNSDHRPVYAIFETMIEPCKNNFTVTGAQFDREIYVEANLRRGAPPTGSQGNSHVCTML